jgi:hypothetical protein
MQRTWGRRATFGAILLFLAVIAPAQTEPWKQYSFSDDGFAATYPSAPPDLQKKSVQTSAGYFEIRSYSAQTGETALIVAVCDYGNAVAGKTSDQMLLGAKKSTLSNSASRLVSEKKITLGTNPGLQFEAENSAAHFTVRIYLVGTTLYQILAVSPINRPFNETARFLDSFQLVNRTKQDSKK